ncbi:hypothetical protein D3C71_328580 [compost metagenome]
MSAFAKSGGGGAARGEVRRFLADRVPAEWEALNDTSYVPAGGFATGTAATSTGLGVGDAPYVSQGSSPGIWRWRRDRFQRFDVDRNVAEGPEYVAPLNLGSGNNAATAWVVLGTRLYGAGFVQSASGYQRHHLMFDTETREFTVLANFPQALSNQTGSWVLSDGRILTTTGTSTVLTAGALTPFWIYNPVTDAVPLEVWVTLPIDRFRVGSNPVLMAPLGGDKFLLLETGSTGPWRSCVIQIVGDAILVLTGAEDSGLTGQSTLMLPAGDGKVLTTVSNTYRSYALGTGWGPGANPAAYGAANSGTRCHRIPGRGWVLALPQTSGNFYVYIYFTSSVHAGAGVVDAVKV